MIILSILFYVALLFESIFKGYQDVEMKTNHLTSDDWKNKYKQPLEDINQWEAKGLIQRLYKWYHKKASLSYKEKYFLSATVLVSLQDPWHRWGFFRTVSLWTASFSFLGILSLYFNEPLLVLIGVGYMVLKPLAFHISYK